MTKSQIPRIRSHMKRSINCKINNLINGPYYNKELFHEKIMETGFIPPESFMLLDLKNYIIEYDSPYFFHISGIAA